MTLVAAHRVGGALAILSDTQLTPVLPPPEAQTRRPSPLDGALKSLVIHPNICVSYAGRYAPALDAVGSLTIGPDPNVDRIVETLLQANRTADGPDFVVAALEDARLVRIAAGAVVEVVDLCLIGDRAAREVYQAAYEEPWPQVVLKPEDEPLRDLGDCLARATTAFQRACREIETVKEPMVIVTGRDRGFRYNASIHQYVQHAEVTGGQSTSMGVFGYRLICTTDAPAVAVYFQDGALGVLYHPLISLDAMTYAGTDIDTFIARVKDDHGITLRR